MQSAGGFGCAARPGTAERFLRSTFHRKEEKNMIQFACDSFWFLLGVLCCATAVVVLFCAAKEIYQIIRNK